MKKDIYREEVDEMLKVARELDEYDAQLVKDPELRKKHAVEMLHDSLSYRVNDRGIALFNYIESFTG